MRRSFGPRLVRLLNSLFPPLPPVQIFFSYRRAEDERDRVVAVGRHSFERAGQKSLTSRSYCFWEGRHSCLPSFWFIRF